MKSTNKMKNLLITIVLNLFLISSSYAQNEFSIVGKWKVVAIEIDNVYKNYRNDSMVVSEDVKHKMQTDKDFNKELENSLKEMKTFEIIFSGTGTCTAFINGNAEPVENYFMDYKNHKLKISNTKMQKDDDVDFTYNNGILVIKMPDDITNFKIELEKVN